MAGLYSSKGRNRNLNLKAAKKDVNLDNNLNPIKSIIYSTAASEIVGRGTGVGMKYLMY